MYVSGEGMKKRREIGLSAFFLPPFSSIAFSFDLLLNGTQTENTPKKLPDTQAITTHCRTEALLGAGGGGCCISTNRYALSLRVHFMCRVLFTCVRTYKIEAMHERSLVNVKVKPRSTSLLSSAIFISPCALYRALSLKKPETAQREVLRGGGGGGLVLPPHFFVKYKTKMFPINFLVTFMVENKEDITL